MEEGRIEYKIVFRVPDAEYEPDVRNMAWSWDGRKHTPWALRDSIATNLISDCSSVSVLHENGIYEFSAVRKESANMYPVGDLMFITMLSHWLNTAGKSLGVWSDEDKEAPAGFFDESIAWACGKLGCDLTVDCDQRPQLDVYKGEWNHRGEVVEPFWPGLKLKL